MMVYFGLIYYYLYNLIFLTSKNVKFCKIKYLSVVSVGLCLVRHKFQLSPI